MIKKISLSALLLLAFGLTPGAGFAQSDTIRSARQDVILSVDKLNQANGQNLSATDKIKEELRLKKDAFEKILALSILETRNLKDKIGALTEVEAELSVLQDTFADQLESYLSYFSGLRDKLRQTTVLGDIEALAGDFNDWRATGYNPQIKKIIDFGLTFQNKTLLRIADQRFSKMTADLKKAKNDKVTLDTLQNLLSKSAVNLKEARNFNNQAIILLVAAYQPSQTVAEIADAVKTNNVETNIDANQDANPSIRDLIALSMINMKSAYKNFVQIAGAVKN